jgi:hypothetical protein
MAWSDLFFGDGLLSQQFPVAAQKEMWPFRIRKSGPLAADSISG